MQGFTTCVLGEIPTGAQVLRLVNRGHPELLLHADGRLAVLAPAEPALPLGTGEPAGGRPRAGRGVSRSGGVPSPWSLRDGA